MMKKSVVLLTVILFATTGAFADSLIFNGPDGVFLGTTHTYAFAGTTVTLTAYNDTTASGGLFAVGGLYQKNWGGDEVGLGLIGDPTGQTEIYSGNGESTPFIQINLSNVFQMWGNIPFAIVMGSSTAGENWTALACSGAGGSGSCHVAATGTNEGVFINLAGVGSTTPYIDVFATATVGEPHPNVLLGGLQSPIPEPSSILLLGTGLSALAGLVRRRMK